MDKMLSPVLRAMPSANKAEDLLSRLTNRAFQVGIGTHDALGAHLIGMCGFDFVWVSGLAVSTSAGVPDASILGMEKFLEAARMIDASTSLPVIADCDTGFGSLNATTYMAMQYVNAGIAGICIEDKQFPKRNSFSGARHDLENIETFCMKIRKIKEAPAPRKIVVIARTESFIAGHSCDEALKRAHAYREAGADAILVHSRSSDAKEIQAFVAAWDDALPVVIAPTTYGSTSFRDFEEMGVTMVICANQLIRASVKSMRLVLDAIRSGPSLSTTDGLICPLHEVVDMFKNERWVDV